MQSPLKFLFLYTRLPDYFFQCIQYLILNSPAGSEAHIVCYPPDENAPYDFGENAFGITIIPKSEWSEKDLEEWKPDLIYVAGWADKSYAAVTEKWKQRIPVITGLDNPWKGTLKQQIASFIAPFMLKKKTSHLWVTGYPQFAFATRLGFPEKQILRGLYCADLKKFKKEGEQPFQKRIVFVGRMVDYKRPHWLADAFAEILKENPALADWQLLMIGNGPLKKSVQEKHGGLPQLKMIDFVQPAELVAYYHQSAVFCLPSLQEHWGVVVHEAAAAGLALLLSDTCGAGSEFLINGYNGASFPSMAKDALKQELKNMMELNERELKKMGLNSTRLSERITHETWAATITSVLHG